jgi:hypothetical protein
MADRSRYVTRKLKLGEAEPDQLVEAGALAGASQPDSVRTTDENCQTARTAKRRERPRGANGQTARTA